jgi:hypothetical protein
MKKFLTVLVLTTGLRHIEAISQNVNQKSVSLSKVEFNSKRLTLAQLYRLADSVRRANRKFTSMWIDEGSPSVEKYKRLPKTMWIDDGIHSDEKFKVLPKTMWIEDSLPKVKK